MNTYPKRPSHFAHRFVRLMMKAVAAQEVGPEGFCLLSAIAMTEDAKRYRGPVIFYNHHLMTVCGFKTEKILFRVRTRCVKAGWLVWNRGRKNAAATYWVAIPEQCDAIEDGPVDEVASCRPEQEGVIADLRGHESVINREVIGNQSVSNREVIGQTFIPNPCPLTPSPDPSKEPVSGFRKVHWWKGLNDTDLADDSKLDVLFGAVVAAGYAHDSSEDRQRFAALVFNVRRSKAKKKFGLFARILEGRVKSKFTTSKDWRNRPIESDHDAARRALKALDGIGQSQAVSLHQAEAGAARDHEQGLKESRAKLLAKFPQAASKNGKAAS